MWLILNFSELSGWPTWHHLMPFECWNLTPIVTFILGCAACWCAQLCWKTQQQTHPHTGKSQRDRWKLLKKSTILNGINFLLKCDPLPQKGPKVAGVDTNHKEPKQSAGQSLCPPLDSRLQMTVTCLAFEIRTGFKYQIKPAFYQIKPHSVYFQYCANIPKVIKSTSDPFLQTGS